LGIGNSWKQLGKAYIIIQITLHIFNSIKFLHYLYLIRKNKTVPNYEYLKRARIVNLSHSQLFPTVPKYELEIANCEFSSHQFTI
jgi:hypothetical protein